MAREVALGARRGRARRASAGTRGFGYGQGCGQRTQPVLAAGCGRTAPLNRLVERSERTFVEIFVLDGDRALTCRIAQDDLADRSLGHHVATEDGSRGAVYLDACTCVGHRECIVQL